MAEIEIIDDRGVIESPFTNELDAKARLDELREENFDFSGDVKIIQVLHRER